MGKKFVSFRIDDDVNEKASIKAAALGTSVSALSKLFIMSLAKENTTEDFENVINNERLRFSLSTEEKEAIAHQAQLNDWSMSRECRFRIISSLSAASRLLPDELKKIKGLRAAIDAVGRNIRHMMFQSKKLEVNDPAFLKEIETLNNYIAMAIKKIDALQEATVDRWSFNRRGMKG